MEALIQFGDTLAHLICNWCYTNFW